MRRIPPYIDCILQYYLMETCGQIACTARTLPIRFTVGTGGTIRGRHRRRSGCVVQPDIGDLRSDRMHGEDARHDRGFHGGHRRHNRGRYRRHDRGATCNPLHGGGNPTQGSIRRTIDFGGVRK